MSAVDIARDYLRRGWCPIPVQFKSKKPNSPDWQHMQLRDEELERVFGGETNIGVVLGPAANGLTDVDLDCREAIELASYVLQKTNAMFGGQSAPASHSALLARRSPPSRGMRKATIKFQGPDEANRRRDAA